MTAFKTLDPAKKNTIKTSKNGVLGVDFDYNRKGVIFKMSPLEFEDIDEN